MMLDEETFEDFGYYPAQLSPTSSKLINVACDNCGEIRTVRKSLYRSLCFGCAMAKQKHIGRKRHKTKPEQIFEEICEKNNLPFKYTGDGSFWIGGKPALNPDFINTKGKKVCVEVFGNYWHSTRLGKDTPYIQTHEGRREKLKEHGWELIVFWENDLKRDDAEQLVLSKLL